MSITLTLHLWWLGVYLAIGVVLWWPLAWLAWRSLARPRDPFLTYLGRNVRHFGRKAPLYVLLPIVAWPLAVWEELH